MSDIKPENKSRLINVEIVYYNPDKKDPWVRKTEVMSVNTMIAALAGAIHNVASTIPNTPVIRHTAPLHKIKELSDAIQDLTEDDIDYFDIEFPYSAGTQKTYIIKGEVK